MKKIFMFMSSVFLASPIYADAITDGISTAGDASHCLSSSIIRKVWQVVRWQTEVMALAVFTALLEVMTMVVLSSTFQT